MHKNKAFFIAQNTCKIKFFDVLLDALSNHSVLAGFNKVQASTGTLYTYEQDLFLNVKTPEQVVKVMDEEWQKRKSVQAAGLLMIEF
jgi:hypothetical protein